ncbi:MAG: phosphatase PAP2 family protein [Hyphomicrobium sp.]
MARVFECWRLPTVKLCLASLAACYAVAGLWALQAPFAIEFAGFKAPLGAALMCGIYMLAAYAFVRWFAADHSRPATIMKTVATRFYELIAAIQALLIFAPAAVLLSYLIFSAGFPMQDAAFARMDSAFGFDFAGFVGFLNAHPDIGWLLIRSYQSCIEQIFVILLLLAAVGRTDDLWNVIALLILGCIVTVIISGLVPAIAPYTYYGVDPASYDALEKMSPGIGRYHVADVLALHSGQYAAFEFGKNAGLITFPSYHAMVAFTAVYGMRSFKYAFWPVAALNVLVIVSTIPVGGHYLVDIIGGGAVFIACLALIDKCNRRPSMWSRLALAAPAPAKAPVGRQIEAAE